MRLPPIVQKVLDVLHDDLEKIGRSIESKSTQQHATESDKQPDVKSPLIVRLEPQAESDEEKTRKSDGDRRDTARLGVEQVALRISILALAVTTIVAVANIGLWIETRNAVNVAAVSAAASQRSAAASEAQAKTTQSSVESTVANFRLEQRAWIGPQSFVLQEMKSPNPVVVMITIINSGKTPALHVRVRYLLHSSDTPINATEYAKNPIEKTVGPPAESILLPNATAAMYPASGSPTDELALQMVSDGRKLIYVFAWVSYSDVFGARHKTQFCSFYDHKFKQFGDCAGNFNYAD